MRPNIDLTENRMFSDRHQFMLGNRLTTIVGTSNEPKFKMIPLGNRTERASMRWTFEALSEEYCQRCGDTLMNLPWREYVWGLCGKCSKLFEDKSTLWHFPKDTRDSRSVLKW